MAQGLVIALVVDPETNEILEETQSFYSRSDNPIKRAEQVTAQFAQGMKGWGKDRRAFGQSVIDRGLTLVFKPVIVC